MFLSGLLQSNIDRACWGQGLGWSGNCSSLLSNVSVCFLPLGRGWGTGLRGPCGRRGRARGWAQTSSSRRRISSWEAIGSDLNALDASKTKEINLGNARPTGPTPRAPHPTPRHTLTACITSCHTIIPYHGVICFLVVTQSWRDVKDSGNGKACYGTLIRFTVYMKKQQTTMYMLNLLGWLETRLAQSTFNYLDMALITWAHKAT